ncbi:MAG TPA: hypothetical protein V6D04_13940, partial [Candidatus Obscuribacterales bacterium]
PVERWLRPSKSHQKVLAQGLKGVEPDCAKKKNSLVFLLGEIDQGVMSSATRLWAGVKVNPRTGLCSDF